MLYHWRISRSGKTGKQGKVGVKRKGWVQLSLPILRNESGSSNPRWNQWDKPPNEEKTHGAGTIKGWENKRERDRIPDTFI